MGASGVKAVSLLSANGFGFKPGLQPPDGLALQRKFNMLVAFVRVAEGVAQQGHADLARYAELEQSGVEGVAEIMEPGIPDSSPAYSCFPSGFYTSDGLTLEGKDKTLLFPHVV